MIIRITIRNVRLLSKYAHTPSATMEDGFCNYWQFFSFTKVCYKLVMVRLISGGNNVYSFTRGSRGEIDIWLFTIITSDTVNPYTGRGHRLSKSEFYSIRTQVFAVHRSHSFDDTAYVGVLAEGIARYRALFLNIYFLQHSYNSVIRLFAEVKILVRFV